MKAETTAFDRARKKLWVEYQDRIEVNPALNRSLVSYQANRHREFYRWFKYKEGFSAQLVEYVLKKVRLTSGRVLDPFAGVGTSLFASRDQGCNAEGIELLPVGVFAMNARLAAERVCRKAFGAALADFNKCNWRRKGRTSASPFQHLRITKDCFPPGTEQDIASFREYAREQVANKDVSILFESACVSVLESTSYTRKDGQYLRWDERAPRTLRGKKKFNKGHIPTFENALTKQLEMIWQDLSGANLFPVSEVTTNQIGITQGSCLRLLPQCDSRSFDIVITSPPYCNRYDYTRTYAVELAYLGVGEDALKELRQDLLSCTVENRAKTEQLASDYRRLGSESLFHAARIAFENQAALHEVLTLLEQNGREGLLNNVNVPRMVRNYFLELTVVIHEFARVLKPGGYVMMVNDNVQYAGEEVPVDLILCDLAKSAGFVTEHIWTLGRGKGNSSQQMGAHGRNELRKCAYLWRLGR